MLNGQRDWQDVAALSNAGGSYTDETMSAVKEQDINVESMSVAQFEAKQAIEDKKEKAEKEQQLAELKRQHEEQEQDKMMAESLLTVQKDLR
jgi:hypothetical protein